MIYPPKIDAFVMLLARLDWPLLPVRLMATRRLAELLSEDHDGHRREQFLNWLLERQTETEVVNGLVVLGLFDGDAVFELSEVVRNIQYPSILADNYLEEIYGTRPQVFSWGDATSGPAITGFEKNGRFIEGIASLAAPICRTAFNGLEKEYGFPFMEQWEWEWRCLNNRINRSSPHPRYFSDDSSGQPIRGDFNVREGDIFKSAFIRTLHFAISEWDMPISLATDIANIVAPANLDITKVEPSISPRYWPSYKNDDSIDEAMSPEAINKMLSPLLDTEDAEMVIAANSHIYKSKKRWVEAEYLCGFIADHSPIESDDFMQALYAKDHPISALRMPQKVSARLTKNDRNDVSSKVAPISLRLFPDHVGWPRSHIFTITRGLFAPSPELFGSEIQCQINEDSVLYKVNGKLIGRWIYWYNPWSPSHPIDAGGSIGTALLLKVNALEDLKNKTNEKFVACSRITKHFRQSEFEEWQSESIAGFN